MREKLIEVLRTAPFGGEPLDHWWFEEMIANFADHLITNGVTFCDEVEELKATVVHQRKRADTAETFICTMCSECDYEVNDGVLIMQMRCCSWFPECEKFKLRPSWIPVTERMPEEHESIVPGLGMVSGPVLVTWMDPNSKEPYPGNSFVREGITRNGEFTLSHINGDLIPVAWMPQPKPYDLTKKVE